MVAVIAGADDVPVYRAGARYLAEHPPGAVLVEIDGAGHDPHHDRPAQVRRPGRALRLGPAVAASLKPPRARRPERSAEHASRQAITN